jgi:cobalt transport protein ATP-binding subunit
MERSRAVEIEGLHFAYPDGHTALQGVNLTVTQGERIGLVGPNGAGKSTLLLHLNGLLSGRGQVRITGMSVTRNNLKHIRARIGLVFQDPDDQLFSTTVFDDVAYGPIYMGLPTEEVRRRVRHALALVNMEGFEKRVPYHLSGGEKRAISLATVLSMSPDILALDEPTSGLDPRARRRLIQTLSGLPQTLLIATHDMRLVKEILPRTVIMDGGKVVADGQTETIMRDTKLLERHGLEAP